MPADVVPAADLTLPRRFAAAWRDRGGACAVQWEGRDYRYDELQHESEAVAAGLRAAGIRPGDRVVVGLPNSAELIWSVAGVLWAGAILVPLNPAATPDEARYLVADCGATAAIVTADHEMALAVLQRDGLQSFVGRAPRSDAGDRAATVEPDDPAMIVYTSGTTGKPKGAVLSHRALVTNLTTVAAAWEWTSKDRLLLVLPCFHLHGLGLGILASLMVGSAILLRRRFELESILHDLSANRATMFFGVPTIYNRLVGLAEAAIAQNDLSAMRLWVSGSAPLNPVTFERFRERFHFAPMDRYGMTECCFALSTVLREERRPGVVGRALPGVAVRLVDAEEADRGELRDAAAGEQGEILVRGPNVFQGYWGRPEATRSALLLGQDGKGSWLRTGDIAVREDDGQIRILGRSSIDIIKTRGFKVGAGEIEEVLQRIPGVEEVAVVGVPDADQGERIVAAVVASGGANLDLEDLRKAARLSLAPHKVPGQFVVIDEIPKTGPGKFKKRELIERLKWAE